MHQTNEIGSTDTVMSSPTLIMTSHSTIKQQKLSKLDAFDLMRVALSSTLAITVFVVIGHVVRHIAGPSAILSVIFAAFIAILVGTFYAELNCTLLQTLIRSNKRLTNVRAVSTIETHAPDTINQNANPVNETASSIDRIDFMYSDWLLPSYALAYIFHGEFTAFIIGWNLMLEIVVCLALVAKASVSFFDAVAFDGIAFRFEQAIPMSWPYAGHFDAVALFVPILIGIPMLLILRRNSILNTVSIALSLLLVVIFLIFGIMHADTSKWSRTLEPNNHNIVSPTTLASSTARETGGSFFAYGLTGMFQGAAIILFAFIAFDAMIMSRCENGFGIGASKIPKQQQFAGDGCEKIENFITTIPHAILLINGGLFLCLLGMAFALTTIQPYHLLDEDLPILSIVNTVIDGHNSSSFRIGMRFIILIAGFIAFVGSLYALLHSLQRTIQMMFSPSMLPSSAAIDLKFKLFEKFSISNLQAKLQKPFDTGQQNDQQQYPHTQCPQYRQGNDKNNEMISCTPNDGNERVAVEWQTVGCLLFALLSGLLAALFAMEHLINILGIGTLLMLYIITIDIIILRYSIYMKHLLHRIPNPNGSTSAVPKPSNSMHLISILLCVYCILSACLAIFLQAILNELWTIPNAAAISIAVVLIVGLLVIVFMMGTQLKRNAIFELSILKNPLIPAVTLFGCIFLFTSFGVRAWCRIGVWMSIGIPLYLALKRFGSSEQRTQSLSGLPNDGCVAEDEPSSEGIGSKTTLKLEDDLFPIQMETSTRHVNDGNQSIEIHAIESVEFMSDEMKCTANVENIATHPTYETITENENVQRRGRSSVNKYDEISCADDIREICIEKREPNGKTYFIEIKASSNANHETASNSGLNSTNDKSEQNIIGNVPTPNDVECQCESEPHSRCHAVHSLDANDSEDERRVKAVVHVSDDATTIQPNELASNDVKIVPIQPQMNEGKSMEKIKQPGVIKAIETRQKTNFRIGAYEAIPKQKLLFENDDNRLAFKMRLEKLFGQSDSRRINDSPTTVHALRFTNSAPDSLILLNLNHDALTTPTDQQCQSKLPSNNDANDDGSSKIPIPPIFDPHLYETVGRRNKNIPYQTTLSTPASHAIDIEVLPMPMKTSNLSRSQAHENLTIIGQNNNNNVDLIDTDPAPETIKRKLEEIFSRKRTQNNNDVMAAAETFDQNDGIVLRKIKPITPFDTVKRQKLIFSNVSKSIRSDSSTNPLRTSSFTSTDIKNAQLNESAI